MQNSRKKKSGRAELPLSSTLRGPEETSLCAHGGLENKGKGREENKVVGLADPND